MSFCILLCYSCCYTTHRLDTDVAFGNSAGVTSTLVLTGVCQESEVIALTSEQDAVRPKYVMSGLASLLPALLSAQQQ
jgi:ribonucleotide monophosphatase NagD (HAD superfamily)